ncbi:MAG: hypothetical protein R3F55_22165 [Alphaproteobacteria bacterium]
MGVSIGARVVGIVLMVATIGLASCQAFLTGAPDDVAALGTGTAGETPAAGEG